MPAINKPNQHFDATLYTGNGGTQSITNSGFQPDWVWAKNRTTAGSNHRLFDSVRGASKILFSSLSNAESTDAAGLTSFDSNGFSIGSNSINDSATNFVAWQWKAGGTAVTNTTGTISTQVSANPTAGFSVMTYTGNGTNNATIGHGLGAVPKFLIWKPRASSTDWMVWHAGLSGYNYDLRLNTTANEGTGADPLNNTAPGSSVVTLRNQGDANGSGTTIVCYAFAEIAGYSAFGRYTGNGSAAGPFIYTGFRPKFVLWKRITTTGGHWGAIDSARNTFNLANLSLLLNGTDGDATNVQVMDLLSNGFKIRTSDSGQNLSADNFIYAAFAEAPFKFANGR